MEIVRQLSVFLANQPGTLAAVGDALAREGINIFALTVSDTVDHAVVRMVVSDPDRALHLCEQRGTLAITTDVLAIDSDNQPGSLAKLARTLAAAEINIEYAYFATSPRSAQGLLVLRVSDPGRAMEVLAQG